jgi:hypothetical protein
MNAASRLSGAARGAVFLAAACAAGLLDGCYCKRNPSPAAPPAGVADPSGASGTAAREPVPDAGVLIRLHNVSDTLEMRSAYGVFPEDTVLFGDIPARGYSEYRQVRRSYRYAYLRVIAGGREWSLQPTDFTGEKPLAPGRYTWEIKPHNGPYPGFLDFEALPDKGRP